jgi:hypothetical protein
MNVASTFHIKKWEMKHHMTTTRRTPEMGNGQHHHHWDTAHALRKRPRSHRWWWWPTRPQRNQRETEEARPSSTGVHRDDWPLQHRPNTPPMPSMTYKLWIKRQSVTKRGAKHPTPPSKRLQRRAAEETALPSTPKDEPHLRPWACCIPRHGGHRAEGKACAPPKGRRRHCGTLRRRHRVPRNTPPPRSEIHQIYPTTTSSAHPRPPRLWICPRPWRRCRRSTDGA